jgi:hypothetical protein
MGMHDKSTPFYMQLRPQDRKALDRAAKKAGVTKAALIRVLIQREDKK